MRILAVDPGSHVAAAASAAHSVTYVLSRNPKRADERPSRLSSLAEQLTETIHLFHPDFVVYEEQFVRGGAATKALFGAVGVIECVAASNGCGVTSVPQSSLRKWALAMFPELKGRWKDLYRAVAARYRPQAEPKMTEHECDAVALYHYVMENKYE